MIDGFYTDKAELLRDINIRGYNRVFTLDITKAVNEFDNRIKLILNERELKVLYLRFEGKTLEQVGKEIGVTRERIRQIEQKTLKKLNFPVKAQFLLCDDELIEEEKEIVKKIEELSLEYKHLLLNVKHLKSYLAKCEEDGIESLPLNKADLSIDELDISVRSYNGLKRAGVNTVRDILDKGIGGLLKIRNLGRKSVKEIIKKMEELGFTLEDMQNL